MLRIPPLETHLRDHAHEYDFFQAVRLLHRMQPDRGRIGRIAKPDDEPVRFRAWQSLKFPPSAIREISADSDPLPMTVTFMSLTGIQGVLPHHYTEHILARGLERDYSMAAFFDLFNHRIVSLFYRAWEKHQFAARFELAAARGEHDDFTQYLMDWIGLGTQGLQGRMSVPDQALLRYGGLIGQRPACAISLRAILRDYFGVPVAVEEFVGAWYKLQPDDQTDLSGEGDNNRLGEGAIAGDAVYDPQAAFRVKLGPLPLVRFLAFLPDGKAVEKLRDLVRFYVGPVLQFDLQLVLRGDEVPWCRLGDETPAGPRLGWSAWLKTGEMDHHVDEAVF